MQGDPVGGLISAIIWMVLLIAIFYFLLYRPQQQQRKKHEEFLKNLKKGEKVITSGGIIGEIKSIDEKTVSLKISEGTKQQYQHTTRKKRKKIRSGLTY